MKKLFNVRTFLLTLGAALLFASQPASALAQCAMCRASVQTGGNASAFSEPLNQAILVLLIPPALLFCAIFFLLYRYRKTMDERQADALHSARSH
jgi:hypothetical protein